MPSLDRVAPPAGYADAWTFLAPVVEMPVYLRWLAARVEELGGTITRLNLSALPDGTGRGRQLRRPSARGCWPRTRRWCRCAVRW